MRDAPALTLAYAAGISDVDHTVGLPALVTVACPPCRLRPSPACTACLGRGRVHLIAELVAAGAGAIARWERFCIEDAAAGRVAPGGAVRLPSGEVAYGVAADLAAGVVALVDLPEHAERLAAEQRALIAAWSRRRERARVAIATARRQLALVAPPTASVLEAAS